MSEAPIRCRTYTYARRYPLVVGKIGGASLWWPLSVTQLGTLCATLLLMHASRGLWAGRSPIFNLLVGLGVPSAAAWAVRHMRLEGRSPFATALGGLALLGAPRSGRTHGRPGPVVGKVMRASGLVWIQEG